MTFLFVGEERSPRARAMGVRWHDGRLAARSLFDALDACGLDPRHHRFCNLFEPRGLATVRRHHRAGATVVGMGRRVQRELRRAGIPHRSLVHPAARGAIRRKPVYAAHVRAMLAEGRGAMEVQGIAWSAGGQSLPTPEMRDATLSATTAEDGTVSVAITVVGNPAMGSLVIPKDKLADVIAAMQAPPPAAEAAAAPAAKPAAPAPKK